MNKLVILTISFIIFMVIILPISLTFLIRIVPGGIQPPLGNTKKIYEEIKLSQEFISPEDNLTGIGVSIKNPNFANKKAIFINISDASNEIIRKITLNGQNIADGKFVKILFEPIKDSKDKKYAWSISSPESTFDDAIEVFLTNKQPAWSLDFKVNDKVSDEGLSYVTLHRPSDSTAVLNKVMNEWFRKMREDSVYFISYSLLILFLIGMLCFPNLR